MEDSLHVTSLAGNKTPNKWVVLAIASVGVFMVTLDSSIVNIPFPR